MRIQLLQSLLLLGFVILSDQRIEDTHVQILYSWKFPDWNYGNEEAKHSALQSGNFVPQNAVILDSDYYFCKHVCMFFFCFFFLHILR